MACLGKAVGRLGIVGLLIFAPTPSWAEKREPITAQIAVPALAPLKRTYEISNFRLGGKYDLDRREAWHNGGEGGTTLESLGAGPLKVAYIAVGTPKRNAAGEIINAIIINTYYSGDASNLYAFWYDGQAGNAFSGGPVVGPGRLFDTNKYYVVMLDAIGLWGASKPSDGLGTKFPRYNNYDLVQANYRLLKDHLKVGQVVLATGMSMGGSQSYVWGVLHSDYVKAIMPIGGATAGDRDDPVQAWVFQLMTAAIESDPVWQQTKGNYYHLPKEKHPNQGVMFGWSVLTHTGLALKFRSTQPWDAVVKEVFYWEAKGDEGATLRQRAKDFDAVDLWYRNAAGPTYNINKQLGRISARTLVVHVETDQWLIVDNARAAAAAIRGGQIVTFPHNLAHYAIFRAPNEIGKNPIAQTFFREIGLLDDADKQVEAANYVTPKVALQGDATKSFWKTQVTYPFPVKEAKGKDERGVVWTIGYMDEYYGSEKNPQTLVIIHGKGAFGGHYGGLMKFALERGLRVIVPDLPHYGMSGPGNLDKSPARTLTDMREAIHDVVVNQLGVKKAYYLGHSLGGQFATGYALKYPDAVQGLILEGPSGLEEFPRTLKIEGKDLPLFDASYAHDFSKWKEVWGPTGVFESELKKSPQDVTDFFYFRKRDAKTGAVAASPLGYFKADTEYARLHTDQRVAMISGNRRELEQWVTAFIYDIYSIGNELVKDDPKNLYKQLTNIKAPIFLAFGAKEPFIPSTSLNGLTDLSKDVIAPFMRRMTEAGNRPTLKVYPGVGHFIHTDVPHEFARDTVDFVKTGRVNVVSDSVIEALIHSGPVAAADVGSTAARPSGLSK